MEYSSLWAISTHTLPILMAISTHTHTHLYLYCLEVYKDQNCNINVKTHDRLRQVCLVSYWSSEKQ